MAIDIRTGLDKSITDLDCIVNLVNNFLGLENILYVGEKQFLLIGRSLEFFEETGFYPKRDDLCRMLRKIDQEALGMVICE